MRTVGELKEFLKDLNDDMPIVKRSVNFELRGAIDIGGIYLKVEKFKTETREFVDGFDYEKYSHDVYVSDENGIECLYLQII